jgi:hypothetical protein
VLVTEDVLLILLEIDNNSRINLCFTVMKSREQFIMLTIGFIGVLGIQVGLYEFLQDRSSALVYILLVVGSILALVGFDRYRNIEDEEV